jgi:transcription initiation factor TFIIH subunit 4
LIAFGAVMNLKSLDHMFERTTITMAGGNVSNAISSKKVKQLHDNNHPNSTTTTEIAANSTGSSGKSKTKRKIHTVKTTGVFDYIRNALPRATLLSLYSGSNNSINRGQYVCRAILQQLPAISRQIVVRIHCAGGAFSSHNVCTIWLNNNTSPSNHTILLHELFTWAIIEEDWNIDDTKNNPEMVTLTQPFRIGLSEALRCFEVSPWTPIEPSQLRSMEEQVNISKDSSSDPVSSLSVTKGQQIVAKSSMVAVSSEDLERFVQQQWDAVLHFLVGTVGYAHEPPAAMVHFLLQTGLMQSDPEFQNKKKKSNAAEKSSSIDKDNDDDDENDEAPLVITEQGYDFMLQDNTQQIWHFVEQYLRSVEEHDENGVEVLKEALLLLIYLSFAQVGCAYLASSSTLSRISRGMIKDLSHFGLLYIRKIGKSTIFYPTQVATQLMGGTTSDTTSSAVWSLSNKALETALADPHPSDSSHLAIIVQTNFQVCAYTTSELHISMLGLFCDVTTIRRLPNVVFLQITRDSIKSAFALGIQARQILRFLEKHTHPHLRKPDNLEPIPSNIVDQIWLWDRELGRVKFTKVYAHEVLMGNDEYRAMLQHAREIGALQYHNDSRQQLLIDYTYVHTMQAFAQLWRAQAISR